MSKVAAGYLVADGFHRRAAAVKLKRTEIEATLHEGGWEDAEAFAITANTKHGKPLTRTERNRAVQRLLDLTWKVTEITSTTGISPVTVYNIVKARGLRGTLPVEIADQLTDTHLYRIGGVDEEIQPARGAGRRGWIDETGDARSREDPQRDKAVAPEVKAAILDGTIPPITSAGGQVVIMEDTVQRVTEEALRKDAQLAVVAFNSASAQLRSFTADEVAAALNPKIRTATVAQFGLTMAALDALIARLTAKVVS